MDSDNNLAIQGNKTIVACFYRSNDKKDKFFLKIRPTTTITSLKGEILDQFKKLHDTKFKLYTLVGPSKDICYEIFPLEDDGPFYVEFEAARELNESTNTTRSLNDSDVSDPTKQKRSRLNAIEWEDVKPENWPPRMPKEFELNAIYTVPHLDVAGINGAQPNIREKPLLFRQETLSLMNSLSKWKNHEPTGVPGDLVKCPGVIVEGAPGEGKSCTTWAWLLSQLSTEPSELGQNQTTATSDDVQMEESSDSDSKSTIARASNEATAAVSDSKSTIAYCQSPNDRASSILWVHLNEFDCYCIDMTSTHVKRAVLYADQLDLELLKNLLRYSTHDIVVLDGLVGNMDEHKKFAAYLKSKKPGFHIQVCSLAFQKGKSQRCTADYQAGIKHLKMYPWTLDEYKLACSNPAFFNSVAAFLTNDPTPKEYTDQERQQLVEDKFFHAGVCARWMFDADTATIINDVKDMIQSTDNIQSHHDLVIGTKVNNVTNGLVVEHKAGILLFVSEHVAISLAEFCSKYTLQVLYKRAHKLRNRSVLGWIFEMDVIISCKKPGSLNLFNQQGQPHVIECKNEQVTVNSTSDYFEPNIKHPRELQGKFMIPYNCNNPGFDMSKLDHLERLRYHLHFFQITINPDHKFDMQHFLDYIKWFVDHFKKYKLELEISEVSIWMIVPTKSKDSTHPICETVNSSKVLFTSDMALLKHENGERWLNYKYEGQFKVYGFKPHDSYFE